MNEHDPPPASPEEHRLEVTRTARYVTLGNLGPDSKEVWFVLHGYRQLAGRFLRRFYGLDNGSRLIVAPEALNRFYVEAEVGRHGSESVVGGTWMTSEDREWEILDYTRYLDRLWDEVSPSLDRTRIRVTVLGFSQGLHTAVRWVVLGKHRPDRLILWGDYLPPDLPMERAAEVLRDVEVVFVRGDSDPSQREELALDEERRLSEWGIEHRLVTFGEGHEIHPEVLAELGG